MIVASLTGWLANLSAEEWTAIATGGTFLVALIASVAAALQVREARRLRIEQARRFVAVFLESGEADEIFIDLVIKNFGLTPATDVRIDISPSPERSGDQLDRQVHLPALIPTLVPGQEWRTFWDSTHTRDGTGLPERYRVNVNARDSQGRTLPTLAYALDWGPVIHRGHMVVYGTHHAAKALQEISSSLRKSLESAGSGGLKVFMRDGDARDARLAKWYRQ
jgi:hypothetical protein